MSVVLLLVHLLSGDAQLRAVGHDNVITAVGRWIPYRLVFSAENGCNARCEAAQRWGFEKGRVGGRERSDGAQGMVWGGGGDVVPGARVGEFSSN